MPEAGEPVPAAGAEHQEAHGDHAVANGVGPRNSAPPPAAFSGPEHAADALFGADAMAAAREQLRAEEGGFRTGTALADRFEIGAGDGDDDGYLWDLQGWWGGDLHKLWWKTEGHGELGEGADDAEVQALYSRAITPYFDVQAGVRHDLEPSPQRSHAVVGIQGLLPYVFEIDASAFLSEDGDWTGRVEAEYDLRIRQRLVLQPRVELDFAAQAIPELGTGSGLGSVESGIRLRYELRRELAPYVGIAWRRKLGATADLARTAGEDTREWQLVLGVRAWF
ncbi:MAG: copper resistance protein B [Gammaproteobacteria bacterium]|nr:copper resistance protein B [Gammaproteobacteria bacterium]